MQHARGQLHQGQPPRVQYVPPPQPQLGTLAGGPHPAPAEALQQHMLNNLGLGNAGHLSTAMQSTHNYLNNHQYTGAMLPSMPPPAGLLPALPEMGTLQEQLSTTHPMYLQGKFVHPTAGVIMAGAAVVGLQARERPAALLQWLYLVCRHCSVELPPALAQHCPSSHCKLSTVMSCPAACTSESAHSSWCRPAASRTGMLHV